MGCGCSDDRPAFVVDPYRASTDQWTLIYPHDAQRLFPSEASALSFAEHSPLSGRFTLIAPDGTILLRPGS